MDIVLIGVFVVGLVAGFVGSAVGSGGLISIPMLVLFGIPPQVALATNKFGGLGMGFGALYEYIKEKKVEWKYVASLLSVGVVASLIGAKILVDSDPDYMKTLIVILMLLLVPTIFLERDMGIKHKKVSHGRRVAGHVVYFLLAIIGSFFGSVGSLMIATVVYFFGLPMINATATDLTVFTLFSIISVVIFMISGLVDYSVGLTLFGGMMAGGYLGARTAIFKGNRWVKIFFAVIVIVSTIALLLK